MRILVCGDRNWTDGVCIATELVNEIGTDMKLSNSLVIDGAELITSGRWRDRKRDKFSTGEMGRLYGFNAINLEEKK